MTVQHVMEVVIIVVVTYAAVRFLYEKGITGAKIATALISRDWFPPFGPGVE